MRNPTAQGPSGSAHAAQEGLFQENVILFDRA